MNLDTARAIFARHADKFITAYVFGSVAAGTADEHSDIDVILVRDTALPFFDRVREIMDLRLEFGAADMLIYTPAELDEMLAEEGRYFFKHAVRTGYRIEGTQQRADRWLKQAESDLAYAELGLREASSRRCAFSANRSVRKRSRRFAMDAVNEPFSVTRLVELHRWRHGDLPRAWHPRCTTCHPVSERARHTLRCIHQDPAKAVVARQVVAVVCAELQPRTAEGEA